MREPSRTLRPSMMTSRRTGGRLLGAGLWLASCSPATGDDVAGRAQDAARSDDASTTGAGGDDGARPTDANGTLDVVVARDAGVAEDDGPLDGGIESAAPGEPDAPTPGAIWQNGLGMRFVPVTGTN